MNPISYYMDYIKNIREPMDIGMSSAYEKGSRELTGRLECGDEPQFPDVRQF